MLPGNALYFPRFHTTDRTEQHHGDTRGLCASPGGRPGGCAPPQEAALSHPSASGRAVGTEWWPRAQPGLATRAGWAPGSAQGRLRCSPEVLRCSCASSTGQAWLRRLRAHCPSRDRAGGRFCSPPHAGSCHGNSLLGWGQIHPHPLSRPCLPMARGLRAAPPCHPIHPHPLHPARPLAGRLLPMGPCQPGTSRIHPEAALPQAGEAEAPGRAVPGVRGTLPSALQRGGSNYVQDSLDVHRDVAPPRGTAAARPLTATRHEFGTGRGRICGPGSVGGARRWVRAWGRAHRGSCSTAG